TTPIQTAVAVQLPTPALFFFNDSPTTEIHTLSLHDALPILRLSNVAVKASKANGIACSAVAALHLPLRLRWLEAGLVVDRFLLRSEEHTSELQSRENLVCRLLLEKKNR